jgi:hypothetical protein
MSIRQFLMGPLENMDLPSYQWWSSKRKEYNLKFISCLLVAQVFFFIASLSLGISNSESILSRILSALFVDAIIILLINLLYFLWPTLEVLFFKKINKIYRRYCFAMLNLLNVLSVVCVLVFLIYISGFVSNTYAGLFEQEETSYKITSANTSNNVDARKSIDVFINRVHELKTDYFSSIESTVDVNGATITFIGFNPDFELLEYYAHNKGQLNAKIIGRYGVIVDSSDIENALPELIGNNPVISVQISEAAGIKMHKITSSNLGARIEMKLDGSVILRGAITEPLGRFFRLGGSGSISDVSKQAILLKYGALENELFLTKIN